MMSGSALPSWLFLLALTLVIAALRLVAGMLAASLRRHSRLLLATFRRPVRPPPVGRPGERAKRSGLGAFLAARFSTQGLVGLPLTVVGLGAILAAVLLTVIASAVVESQDGMTWDQAILASLEPVRRGPALEAFRWITALGNTEFLLAVALVAAASLWLAKRRTLLLGFAVTALGAEIALWLGKHAFDRARPEFLTDVVASSPSYPSGHAAGGLAIYGYLAYAAARLLGSPALRFEVVFWALVVAFLVGFSRIFLHVHYPTDVLAGFLVGGVWLLLGIVMAEWYEKAS